MIWVHTPAFPLRELAAVQADRYIYSVADDMHHVRLREKPQSQRQGE